ncbi:MAG: lysoplasmalogenase [Clostridia bacterium]|nr:lysoplasmalogenase [Clostridia bacterium]
MTTTMIIYMAIFVCVYVAITISYFFSETSGNFKRRAVNKIGLAALFLCYSIFEFFHLGYGFGSLQFICLIGVFFAFLGDVFLLWSFSKGGVLFGVGNVVLFCYELQYFAANGLAFKDYWWFLIILAVVFITWACLWYGGWYDYSKKPIMKWIFTPYILSVTLHGTLSIAGLFVLPSSAKSILLCCGLILFMISDYFISLHKFKYTESKAILRLNSGTYFIGLMLVALSFSFFN